MADVLMYNSVLNAIKAFPASAQGYWTLRGWYPYNPASVPSNSADPFPQYATKVYVTNAINAIPGGTGGTGGTGATGATGADGRSAYQVAVANGYVGTETQWLTFLRAPATTDASQLTTGILPVARLASGGSEGQVLVKSGSTTAWATITGGGTATNDASALTTGTLAPARIGDTSITDAKLAAGTALTAAERTKLSGVATAATANRADSATDTLLAAKAPLASPAFTGTPTGITKTHVGLGNVDNTADTAKPVSTAQQTALDAKVAAGSVAGFVNHDGSAGGGTRPSGFGWIIWRGGTTRPTNMVAGDAWEHDA